MGVKTILGAVLVVCLAAVKGQPNFATLEACRSELNINDPTKFPCIMACVGKKEGWLTGDGTLDVEKKLAYATQMGMPGSDMPALRAAIEACKNKAKGMTDNCDIGNTLFQCMTSNGAPRPPLPPPFGN